MDNAPRMKAMAGSRIIGTGSALPQRAVGNEQLVAELATSWGYRPSESGKVVWFTLRAKR